MCIDGLGASTIVAKRCYHGRVVFIGMASVGAFHVLFARNDMHQVVMSRWSDTKVGAKIKTPTPKPGALAPEDIQSRITIYRRRQKHQHRRQRLPQRVNWRPLLTSSCCAASMRSASSCCHRTGRGSSDCCQPHHAEWLRLHSSRLRTTRTRLVRAAVAV